MCVSPVLDKIVRLVRAHALNISWRVLDGYVFGPVALIPQVIQKMTTYRCRIIRMASGRLAVAWFWDLVDLSTKVPLRLLLWVNLLTQSFNKLT